MNYLPFPSALFDEYGSMRSSSKAILKNKLHIEVSKRRTSTYDAVIIDGCALLWNIHWPATGTVEQYIKNLVTRLNDYLKRCCMYLIFDRYLKRSTKSATRSIRAGMNGEQQTCSKAADTSTIQGRSTQGYTQDPN